MNAPLDFPLCGASPLFEETTVSAIELRKRIQGRIFLIFAKPGVLMQQALGDWKRKNGLPILKGAREAFGQTAHVIDPFFPEDRIIAWSYYPIFTPAESFFLFREVAYLRSYLRQKEWASENLLRIRFAYRSPQLSVERELLLTSP